MQTDMITQELGRPLRAKEAAALIGIDVKSLYPLYLKFGGVRIGKRRIIFYERRLIDAISKLQQEQREISVVRSGCNDHSGREESPAAQAVPNQKRSPFVGGRGKGKIESRSDSTAKDPYGLLVGMGDGLP